MWRWLGYLWPWIFKVKLYFGNGSPDCHGTKGTGVDRMPWCETLRKWVNWMWRWLGYLWPWSWIFKVKLYLWNGRPDCHGTKGTGVDRMPWCETQPLCDLEAEDTVRDRDDMMSASPSTHLVPYNSWRHQRLCIMWKNLWMIYTECVIFFFYLCSYWYKNFVSVPHVFQNVPQIKVQESWRAGQGVRGSDIGSGNGLLLSRTKPLSEPMLASQFPFMWFCAIHLGMISQQVICTVSKLLFCMMSL